MFDANQQSKLLIVRNFIGYVFRILRSLVTSKNIAAGIIGIISALVTNYIDRTYFQDKTESSKSGEPSRVSGVTTPSVEAGTVDVSEIVGECTRYKTVFAKLYQGYPTVTCDINVYRLPAPDKSFVSYLEGKRDALRQLKGVAGGQIVSNFSMSSDAHDRMFNNKYFRSTIEKETTMFRDYYKPIVAACKTVNVEIRLQECPFY